MPPSAPQTGHEDHSFDRGRSTDYVAVQRVRRGPVDVDEERRRWASKPLDKAPQLLGLMVRQNEVSYSQTITSAKRSAVRPSGARHVGSPRQTVKCEVSVKLYCQPWMRESKWLFERAPSSLGNLPSSYGVVWECASQGQGGLQEPAVSGQPEVHRQCTRVDEDDCRQLCGACPAVCSGREPSRSSFLDLVERKPRCPSGLPQCSGLCWSGQPPPTPVFLGRQLHGS
jgi:hypothetical protein